MDHPGQETANVYDGHEAMSRLLAVPGPAPWEGDVGKNGVESLWTKDVGCLRVRWGIAVPVWVGSEGAQTDALRVALSHGVDRDDCRGVVESAHELRTVWRQRRPCCA